MRAKQGLEIKADQVQPHHPANEPGRLPSPNIAVPLWGDFGVDYALDVPHEAVDNLDGPCVPSSIIGDALVCEAGRRLTEPVQPRVIRAPAGRYWRGFRCAVFRMSVALVLRSEFDPLPGTHLPDSGQVQVRDPVDQSPPDPIGLSGQVRPLNLAV